MTTFCSPYNQYKDKNGQNFTIIREINMPDDKHDAEVLPMYLIRFDDGTEIEAWPEEVGK